MTLNMLFQTDVDKKIYGDYWMDWEMRTKAAIQAVETFLQKNNP